MKEEYFPLDPASDDYFPAFAADIALATMETLQRQNIETQIENADLRAQLALLQAENAKAARQIASKKSESEDRLSAMIAGLERRLEENTLALQRRVDELASWMHRSVPK